ncbi:hypothetical protein NLU66_14120 [Brachybacterium sp. NBEC-018]|uniref:hypothetical protein n=1 Tax=Brachybacterium sp. NBEC-018 TaxID=2996004 RepID=UPI002174D4AE|nr:hypothetical protein [Brachybacterium sp. NBEC-018]UVY83335.1 hypothetical protein NLU66_14120 [Brachybacterium sp. NBEC-018]
MSSTGLILLASAFILLLITILTLYSTTMTFRRSRLSPWTVLLGLATLTTGIVGVVLL